MKSMIFFLLGQSILDNLKLIKSTYKYKIRYLKKIILNNLIK